MTLGFPMMINPNAGLHPPEHNRQTRVVRLWR